MSQPTSPPTLPPFPHRTDPSSAQIEKGSLKSHSVESLNNRLKVIERDPVFQVVMTPPHYRDEFSCLRIALAATVTALVIIGIVAFALYASNHLLTLPQDFIHAFQNATYLQWSLGIGIPIVLVTGALTIILNARKKREELEQLDVTYKQEKETGKRKLDKIIMRGPSEIGASRGVISGIEDHLEVVHLKCKDFYINDYVDRSTLDENGDGRAYLYGIKDLASHYIISASVAFMYIPLYLIGVIAYNLIRAVIIPFYILFQCLRDAYRVYNKEDILYPDQRAFRLSDALNEFIKSIKNVIRAPFYALAYFFAAFYSLFNPMGGRKLAAAIERDWNDGASLAEGFWSVRGGQTFWQFEGGGGPLRLGRNGFCLAGCWHPIGVAEFRNWEITKAYSLTKAVDPNHGTQYTEISTRTDLEKRAEGLSRDPFKRLYDEYTNIQAELRTRE